MSDSVPIPDANPEPPAGVTPAATTEAGANSHRWGVLRHTHFRVIWFAAFGSYMGGWFEFVGTQWIVASKTGSTMWMSWIGAAQLFPSLFLGLLGGVVADRVNRKTLLIVTQVAMMLIAIAFAAVVYLDVATPMVLFVLSLLQGIAIAFNAPAWQVLTPRLVPREELVAAITLQGISFNVARAIGPALGGVIMGASNATVLFVINAVSFIGVMIAVMSTPDAPAPPASSEGRWNLGQVWLDTKSAIRFVFLSRGPRAAFLASVVFGLLATPVLRFLPLFVKDVYGLQEKTFGIMTGVMGVGAVAGGLMLRWVPKWYPKHHLIPLSVSMGGMWIFLFAIEDNAYIAAAFMLFVGVFWMWSFNLSMGAMQMLVEDSMRGRVMAVLNTAALGLMPLGSFLASAAGDAGSAIVRNAAPSYWTPGLSAQLGIAFVAAILMAAGVVMLIWRTPEVDGIQPGEPGYDRKPGFWRGITAASHRPQP